MDGRVGDQGLTLDTATILRDAAGATHGRLVPFEPWAKDGCSCGWRSDYPIWRQHAQNILDTSLALVQENDPMDLLIDQWIAGTRNDLARVDAIRELLLRTARGELG